jgi:hypothetical protein
VTNIDVEERSENRKEKGDGTHTQSEHTAALTSIDIEEEITISRVAHGRHKHVYRLHDATHGTTLMQQGYEIHRLLTKLMQHRHCLPSIDC